MREYSIFCTPEQTKKALELGAPIQLFDCFPTNLKDIGFHIPNKGFALYPSGEQIICWLEQIKCFSFDIYQPVVTWSCSVNYMSLSKPIFEYDGYSTRKEATLAAIDAALEYLSEKLIL